MWTTSVVRISVVPQSCWSGPPLMLSAARRDEGSVVYLRPQRIRSVGGVDEKRHHPLAQVRQVVHAARTPIRRCSVRHHRRGAQSLGGVLREGRQRRAVQLKRRLRARRACGQQHVVEPMRLRAVYEVRS